MSHAFRPITCAALVILLSSVAALPSRAAQAGLREARLADRPAPIVRAPQIPAGAGPASPPGPPAPVRSMVSPRPAMPRWTRRTARSTARSKAFARDASRKANGCSSRFRGFASRDYLSA
jgi:hypothetical protein